jgi:hypothetical protein
MEGLTGDEKLAFVQKQFDEIWASGVARTIECPYCMKFVQPGETVCCEKMAHAAAALIERAKLVEDGLKDLESRRFRRSLMN